MSALADPYSSDDGGVAVVAGLVDSVAGTLNVARALVSGCRDVDLQGLDGDIGVLCARVLDLAPEWGRSLRPRLLTLLAELDALQAALQPA